MKKREKRVSFQEDYESVRMTAVSPRSIFSKKSDAETSFIMSDGGTKRVKYADIVSIEEKIRISSNINLLNSFVSADVTNAVHAEKV